MFIYSSINKQPSKLKLKETSFIEFNTQKLNLFCSSRHTGVWFHQIWLTVAWQ